MLSGRFFFATNLERLRIFFSISFDFIRRYSEITDAGRWLTVMVGGPRSRRPRRRRSPFVGIRLMVRTSE